MSKELSYIRGVHIEGGLITKSGVHPKEYLQVFKNLKDVKKLVEKYPGLIKMWTLCPSLDPGGKITKYLQSKGILVSYGHSSATYSQAQKAFKKYGVNTVTHWGNTMFLHKDIKDARSITPAQIDLIMNPESINEGNKNDFGIGYAALHNPNVTLQVICGSEGAKDLHLKPELLRRVIAYKGPERIALVSDVACNTRRPQTNNRLVTKSPIAALRSSSKLSLTSSQLKFFGTRKPCSERFRDKSNGEALRGANQLLHKHIKNFNRLK
jgi:N-acetylglucosamine-6-phosphate deacetylase